MYPHQVSTTFEQQINEHIKLVYIYKMNSKTFYPQIFSALELFLAKSKIDHSGMEKRSSDGVSQRAGAYTEQFCRLSWSEPRLDPLSRLPLRPDGR